VLLVLAAAIAFCVLFLYWQKAEKLDLILGLIFGFATGAFGGFGIAKMTERKKE
jgi:hypothetical protein